MNTTLIQALAAIAFAVAAPLASAAPQKVEQLPRVVITGKSQPVVQQIVHQIVQLPRVVIEGRSSTLMALNSTTKPATRRV